MTASLRKSLQLAPLDAMRRWGNGCPVSNLAGTDNEGGGLRAGSVSAKNLTSWGLPVTG